ncbi:hypothetical protein INS49_004958 [Diaporthe citri]|uniref:uncharacterized protein n=1 Tax=Diaporthe citri TaxID=83186 RepID=UPI001C824DDF|nr:uncharacterized protein INS49_004958 [Diaporthe citri]KAG6353987.1 hypothetical protein INS49_004958 [Diaporthe citri]
MRAATPILNGDIEASCPSVSMVNMYRYQPLSDPRATRLIMLRKSHDVSAPLSCAIVETTLDKPANYYALSYTWGTEAPSEAMYIFPAGDSTTVSTSAEVILLTPNCATALKILRKRLADTDAGVWVDAVCINQSNVAEKNVQVTMMANIYSLAKCVVVWVGQQWAPKNTRICGDKKMLQGLTEAPYWTRAWTLQEIAHSHVKLLCRNDHVIDLKSVFDGIGFVGTRSTDRPGFIYHEIFFRSSQDPRTERPWHWSKELDIYYMSWFISMKASDPRDKIYATRGQFARTFGKIPVDYNRSISSVFADATKQIICDGSDDATGMLVLANASRSTTLRDLPSWAVDWASEDITTRFWESGAPHLVFKATRESQARHRFSEDLKRLFLMGTVVGTVQERHVGPQLSQHFRPRGKDPEEDMTENPETTRAVYKAISSWASDLTAAAENGPRNTEPAAGVQNRPEWVELWQLSQDRTPSHKSIQIGYASAPVSGG